uniref:PiggyBac transposable element-derived protein domain-containing protein n=1 Tax=Sander lucioperca TaxID=283035 RepID=A0A8D0AC50_SANLU
MAKISKSRRYTLQEAVEECTRPRESDKSEEEMSEKDSEMSCMDSVEAHLPTPQNSRRQRGRGRGKGKGRGCSQARSSSPSEERWNDVDVPDITPPQPTFRPRNVPGPQLIRTATYTALQLFQLFFTNSVLKTILQNTNHCGSTHHSTPSIPWIDLTLQDMFAFMSLIVYMGVVKCFSFTDYWRGGHLYSLPFPRRVMTGKKFLRISQSLHLSSSVGDAANEERRGTGAYDRLAKIKPLYEEMRDSCRRNFHPGQEISIDERMVASKARTGLKQYMKNKPVRWGYKLFVLADSRNGYTWDFFVYEGKCQGNSGKGLSYEAVMELIDVQLLGTGYKVFVDNFYTSPILFRDLLLKRIWACGTIRTNRIGFPRSSIRWIRNDSLLFVQWRDTRDVFLCSTLHTAHAEDTVQRRVKAADGQWQLKDVSVPPVVQDYNRCMGGVDHSDALIGYYKVLHKTQRWYKTLFYHFMDIAIVNAFLLQKDLAIGKGEVPLHQKAFRETLAVELAEAGSSSTATPGPPPAPRGAHHRPVHISGHSTAGRLKCRQCHAKTPVKCSSCDIPLCFVAGRDCYNDWHVANDLDSGY